MLPVQQLKIDTLSGPLLGYCLQYMMGRIYFSLKWSISADEIGKSIKRAECSISCKQKPASKKWLVFV